MEKVLKLLIIVIFLFSCAPPPKQVKPPEPTSKQTPAQIERLERKVKAALEPKSSEKAKKRVDVEDLIHWQDKTNRTLLKAQREDKCVFFYFYAPGCAYCEVMEREVFMDTQLSNLINEKTYPIKLNVEDSRLAMVWGVNITPTIYVIDSEGGFIGRTAGIPDSAHQFTQILRGGFQHCKGTPTKDLEDEVDEPEDENIGSPGDIYGQSSSE